MIVTLRGIINIRVDAPFKELSIRRRLSQGRACGPTKMNVLAYKESNLSVTAGCFFVSWLVD